MDVIISSLSNILDILFIILSIIIVFSTFYSKKERQVDDKLIISYLLFAIYRMGDTSNQIVYMTVLVVVSIYFIYSLYKNRKNR